MPLDSGSSAAFAERETSSKLDLRFNAPSVAQAPEETADWSFEVLAAAAESPIVGTRRPPSDDILPTYGGRLQWDRCGVEGVGSAGYHDLTVVACADRAEMTLATQATTELRRQRHAVIFLVPQSMVTPADRVEGALLVLTPDPPVASIALLAHAIISPVVIEGVFCIDWADVLTVLDCGDQAILLSSEGATASEAVDRLPEVLSRQPPGRFIGACCTLLSVDPTVRHYQRLFDLLRGHSREDGWIAATVRCHSGGGTLVCGVAITRPRAGCRGALRLDGGW